MNYLLKTEASAYSFADLEREQTTIWDGVTNPVAVRNLRNMKSGDQLVIYHTGDEKCAVGTASVVSVDPSDTKNPKVRIKGGKPISQPLSLGDIKQTHARRRTLPASRANVFIGRKKPLPRRLRHARFSCEGQARVAPRSPGRLALLTGS